MIHLVGRMILARIVRRAALRVARHVGMRVGRHVTARHWMKGGTPARHTAGFLLARVIRGVIFRK